MHSRNYCLDTELELGEDSGREELESAMAGHVLAMGELLGLFKR